MSDIEVSISGKSVSNTSAGESYQVVLPNTLHSLVEIPVEKRSVRRNNNHPARIVQSRKWSRPETARFYQLLEKYGTDFLMISTEFKSRSKKEILVPTGSSTQNKYKKECLLRKDNVVAAFERNYTTRPLASL